MANGRHIEDRFWPFFFLLHFGLRRAAAVVSSPIHLFLSLCESWQISTNFAGRAHYRERLADYILGQTGPRTVEQDTTEYSNRRQSVLTGCQTGDAYRMNSQISLHTLWQLLSRIRLISPQFVSSKSFTCSLSNAKRSFYRSFNAIFGRVGHIASEAVIVELLNSKCLPTLLYSLEKSPLKSADLKALLIGLLLEHLWKFSKLSQRRSPAVAWRCSTVHCRLFLLTIENVNFCKKNSVCENIICRHCADCAK